MTVISYLNEVANRSFLKGEEKIKIAVSINAIQKRLDSYFSASIMGQMLFGSYTRNTILPRSLDSDSDIDYMVIFPDGNFKPQTYLDRLRRFVEIYYSSSEIKQSHPTIQLELNHIRFELVPAKKDFLGQLYIPSKSSGYSKWQHTDPKRFNDKLTTVNQRHKSFIKPTVRILRYWNSNQGKVFDSYGLERLMVESAEGFLTYYGCSNVWDYLNAFTQNQSTQLSWSLYKAEKFNRLKLACQKAKTLESQGYPISAEQELQKVIPALKVYS
jgi:predicted nucleotidyltransferase